MKNVTYVELGSYGALTSAMSVLRNDAIAPEERIARALALLEDGERQALQSGDGGPPVDLIAILPAQPGEDGNALRAELTRAVSAGDMVELSLKGRIVGVLQAKGGGDAS